MGKLWQRMVISTNGSGEQEEEEKGYGKWGNMKVGRGSWGQREETAEVENENKLMHV